MASISTTALRLAAIEALAPTSLVVADAASGWPTLLAARVADSGSLPFDRDPETPISGLICAGVYCDEVRGTPRGDGYGYAPQDLEVDLIFDLEIPILDDQSGQMATAVTDADAASKLELAAAQIRCVLATSPLLVPGLVKSFGRLESRWGRDPDLGVRLARLTLRLPCMIDDDDWDDVTGGLPAPAAAVRASLPDGSYGAALLDAIAATWVAPDDPVPLASVHFGFAVEATARPASIDDAPVSGAVDLT